MRSAEEILEESQRKLGRTLRARWRLDRLLGVGGMAAVYAACRVDGGEGPREVALKLLHPEMARSPELKRRFEQEATAAAHIKHRGAVLAMETSVSEDGCPFMVMELLDGESLLEHLSRKGEIAPADLLRYMDELLDVLASAHDAGIVHRDIKLDNLFIEKSGRLRVLDFGIARVRSSSITVTGQRLGTTAYMPPEQVRGYEVDGRADLFSVGATMFRAIAKRRVHVASNEAGLLIAMSTTPAPPLRSVALSAPVFVAEIVDRALAFYARERYPDARTMQTDVRAALQGREPPYASRLRATPPSGPSARGSASGEKPTDSDLSDAPTSVPGAIAFDPTVVAAALVPEKSLAGAAGSWTVNGPRASTSSSKWLWPTIILVGVAALAVAVAAIMRFV